MSRKPLEVLIVEDNPGDAGLISEMLVDGSPPVHVTVAEDGQKALDTLRKKNSPSRPAPDIIILDLNLPKVNGFEVLKQMMADDRLRAIPVVVMTGSLKMEDEVNARNLGAVDYCIKPSTVEEMERSAMCLRGHLEALSENKGRRGGSGSSPNANLDRSIMDLDLRIPPRCSDRFIMDVVNLEPRNNRI